MDAGVSDKKSREALMDSLIKLGTEAFKPDGTINARGESKEAFDREIQKIGSLNLIPALNSLIQPGKLPPWLQLKFLEVLTRVPLRPGGVRATVEFIFSVHPSSTVGAPEEGSPQKQGANITQEALNMATRLLGNPPSGMTADAWFSGISPQLFSLLDGQDGPELMKVASYVIGFGILGRRQFGAPGSPGWKAFADPMLRPINPSLGSPAQHDSSLHETADSIVDLSKDIRLFSARALSLAMSRLLSLLISHPNPGLSRRLITPVVLPLWAIASWPDPKASCEKSYCIPARNLLKIYLQITTSPDKISRIMNDILFNGNTSDVNLHWNFQETSNGDIQIMRPRQMREDSAFKFNWRVIESKVDALLIILQSVSTNEDISAVFLDLFGRHFTTKKGQNATHIPTIENAEQTTISQLIETKVLQKMMERFPEQLISQPDAILELVVSIMKNEKTDEDETLSVALSLVNLVVASPRFQKSKFNDDIIHSLETSLNRLAKVKDSDLSGTARNLSLLLRYHDELQDPADILQGSTERQNEDRKTYQLAMSYITQPDSPPPVRSEGLILLQKLIANDSPIIDIQSTLVLMSSLVEENEDYINLRVIRTFTQIANKHPNSVTKELLDHYVDANEAATVDTRLRFSEALLQVIERLGETFAGDTAQKVSQALLSTAGRRGYRPKTEQKQARQERLRNMKKREAEDAWGGKVPDLGEDIDEEEVARNEILSRIVGGWESKRGSEDVRIRASALSVFGAALETNIVGIGPAIVSGSVDLSVNILTMEPDLEKGILRRSAVLLIMSFVRALDSAKQSGRKLGFGLTEESQADIKRVLNYIASTDNDGLVKQHARDVVESLDNLRMGSLVSEAQLQTPTLTKLAGLAINPDRSVGPTGSERPRIEEIE